MAELSMVETVLSIVADWSEEGTLELEDEMPTWLPGDAEREVVG